MINWFNRQIIEYSRPKFLASDDTNEQEEKATCRRYNKHYERA